MATRYCIITEDCAPGHEYRVRAIGVDTQSDDPYYAGRDEVKEITEANDAFTAIDLLRAENGLFEGCDVQVNHDVADDMMVRHIASVEA